MAKLTLANVRTWIDEYVNAHPDGIDVTAYVLCQLGREGVEAHSEANHISFDQAKQEIGDTVKEMLYRKYPASAQLQAIPVNETRWPDLAGWVSGYTTYRIAK